MALTDDHHHIQNTSEREDPPRFVEELADENDYWMSLTDAARVTRTSEAMTRRWVSSGRLPIKKEPAGINQRTRLVRASDVARIRPIIDTTAAITDDIRKLDLLSIPRQQAHIMQEHQSLLTSSRELRAEVKQLAEGSRTAFEQLAMKLQIQAEKWEQRLSALHGALQQDLNLQQQQHEVLSEQVRGQAQGMERQSNELREQREHLRTAVAEPLQEVQRGLERLGWEHRDQVEQMYREYTALLQQQGEQFHHTLQGVEAVLIQHEQAHEQTEHDLVEIKQALATQQAAFTTLVELKVREVKQSFEQQLLEQAQSNMALRDRLELMERLLEKVEKEAEVAHRTRLEDHESLAKQDRLIQTLTLRIQDEIEARKTLSEHLLVQQEQMQILRQEFGTLKLTDTQKHAFGEEHSSV